jgi:dTDP-glucose 4,6-dehydratase
MKFLVTGGLGFIGSNFIRHTLDKYPDCQIINLDLVTYAGNPENLKDIESDSRYKFIKGDICDIELVNQLVRQSDTIVHFAAESHVDRAIENSSVFVRTNVLGTQILLDAAVRNGNKRFHHISTDEVFGSLKLDSNAKFDEHTHYNPHNPYSATKAAADHLARAYFNTYNLPVTISNCSNNFGPYQHPEKLIPLFITNLIEGKKVPLYGTGCNIRDWIYVEDHCRAIDFILSKGKIGETYCIGANSEKSNLELTKEILNLFNLDESMIMHVEDRKGHDLRYAINPYNILVLGWKPQHDFNSALKQTVDWYKRNK